MVEYLLAQGGGVEAAENAQSKASVRGTPRVVHKWVLTDGQLDETVQRSEDEAENEGEAVAKKEEEEEVVTAEVGGVEEEEAEVVAVEAAAEAAAAGAAVRYVTWWHDGALVTTTLAALSSNDYGVTEVTRRFVERFYDSDGINRQARDQMVTESFLFDVGEAVTPRAAQMDVPPIAAVRTTFKRVVANDIIGDLRVKTAWRQARKGLDGGAGDEVEEVVAPALTTIEEAAAAHRLDRGQLEPVQTPSPAPTPVRRSSRPTPTPSALPAYRGRARLVDTARWAKAHRDGDQF